MIAGKWPIQGVWGDLLSRVAGMWYLSATASPTAPPPLQTPRLPSLNVGLNFTLRPHNQTVQYIWT